MTIGKIGKTIMDDDLIAKIRTAVADYMASEGCTCCQGDDHDDHRAALAVLLNVPKFEEADPYAAPEYSFGAFESKTHTPNSKTPI